MYYLSSRQTIFLWENMSRDEIFSYKYYKIRFFLYHWNLAWLCDSEGHGWGFGEVSFLQFQLGLHRIGLNLLFFVTFSGNTGVLRLCSGLFLASTLILCYRLWPHSWVTWTNASPPPPPCLSLFPFPAVAFVHYSFPTVGWYSSMCTVHSSEVGNR